MSRKPRVTPGALPAPDPPKLPPPLHRDPWAWASVAALLPLLARCIGAPLGEPVAEDFDFLRRSLVHGVGSVLDGGGSTAFWRPIPHQLYYAALGPLMLGHPRLVAALHALLLAVATLLVYRALRGGFGGAVACAAATFPALSESTRTLVAWPSQFVDVGLFVFSAIALHEAGRKRLPTALAAALLALFCKEVAVVAAVLLPWIPGQLDRRERTRWTLAFGILLGVWAAAYLAVRAHAHLVLPHGVEQSPAPALVRIAWALRGCLRADLSLPLVAGRQDGIAIALGGIVLGGVTLGALLSRRARAGLRARQAWIAWGLAWFALSSATLAPIHPLWQPNRAHFGAAGLGIAAIVACDAVHPGLAALLVVGRSGLLALAPGAVRTISEEAPQTGAFMDFEQLSRLERFMASTHAALAREYPHATAHTHVIEMNLPHGLLYALGGDHAVQVWYRDTTVAMVNFTALAADSSLATLVGVQFQPHSDAQVVLLSPAAMRAQDQAYRHLLAGRYEAAIAALDRADSLEPRADHTVFHGNNAGYRASAFLRLVRVPDAVAESRRALALDDTDANALRTLVLGLTALGRTQEALVAVDDLLRVVPDDRTGLNLRARLLGGSSGIAR